MCTLHQRRSRQTAVSKDGGRRLVEGTDLMREKTGGISAVEAGGGTLEFDFLKSLSLVFLGLERFLLCGMWILVVLLS